MDLQPGYRRERLPDPESVGEDDELLAAIERIESDGQALVEHYVRHGGEYARGEGLFPERIHVNTLIASLGIEQGIATARWARWAREEVERWDGTETPAVDWAVRTLNQTIERASSADG